MSFSSHPHVTQMVPHCITILSLSLSPNPLSITHPPNRHSPPASCPSHVLHTPLVHDFHVAPLIFLHKGQQPRPHLRRQLLDLRTTQPLEDIPGLVGCLGLLTGTQRYTVAYRARLILFLVCHLVEELDGLLCHTSLDARPHCLCVRPHVGSNAFVAHVIHQIQGLLPLPRDATRGNGSGVGADVGRILEAVEQMNGFLPLAGSRTHAESSCARGSRWRHAL
mmetsp:Transcript_39312/g.98329  ORF Transcript_39312/g.98329 Transcript_39312/m.98329 type:complete len:222 (-) Transcript_39312:915-1580(-)